jgi:CheY-like chemotaxis protein
MPLPAVAWETPEAWLQNLESRKAAAAGIVLPLELTAPSWPRSRLYGLELLRWLRWSGGNDVRLTPVLALAWQSLDRVLRLKPEVLLVASGTYFVRLPEAIDIGASGGPSLLHSFIEKVQIDGNAIRASEADLDKAAFGSLGEAAQISHHDLANEGYAAWRLWEGYKQALRDADGRGQQEVKDKLRWAEAEAFSWLPELERKSREPAFRQFQISRRGLPVPKYPEVPKADGIVRRHAVSGPPAGLRILFVDDEFDKGLADVLLKILFAGAGFTFAKDGADRHVSEAFYCDEKGERRWIRLACVKTARDGVNWLKHWKHIEEEEDSFSSGFFDWLESWRASISARGAAPNTYNDRGNFLRRSEAAIDSPTAPPAKPITVVLLDLRLAKGEPEVVSDPNELESLRFREWLKSQEVVIPVVMLTASRQVLNYAAAMSGAAPHDGWLTKEAPDVPLDDRNSARAVHYLLDRLHLYSTLLEWYGDHLGWELEWINAYSEFWCDQHRDDLLRQIGELASKIFKDAQHNRCDVGNEQQFWGYIKTAVRSATHPLVARLVARRVALACLLYTADWNAGTRIWNVEKFGRIIPHDPRGREEKRIDGVVNFTRDLWLPTAKSPEKHLLREEYDWLVAENLSKTSKTLTDWLNQCRAQAFDR